MRHYLLHFLLIITANISCFAQAPVISSVQPVSAGPTQKIVITGNGFSSTSSQLAVWFDHVRGTITSSSNFSIEVQVPPQAHFSNIEVINLSNNLSAKSSLKFLPSYGGSQFSLANMQSAYSNIELNYELFDVAGSDLDLDGKPDLVVTKGGPVPTVAATDINIYQNTSSGIGNVNFVKYDKTNLAALNVTAQTANVACDDLNGDGKPDIVLTGGGSKRNQVFVLKNTNAIAGTLAFAAPLNLTLPPPNPLNPTQNAPLSFEVAIRDLNSDGKPEIVISNAQDDSDPTTDNRIFIFQNTSSGGALTFNATPIQISVTGANSTYGLEVQDLDGDSMPDIIVNQFFSNNVFILRNTSTGNITFAPVQKITAPGSLTSILATDLDRDGLPDLVATATNDNSMQIWFNQSSPGNISFGGGQPFATASGPWGIDAGDIEGDGDVDIIVSNKNGSNLNIFIQGPSKTFTKQDLAITGNFSRNLKLADYDADGKPDIIYTGIPTASSQFTINVLRNSNCWNPILTSVISDTSPVNICASQKIRLQTKPALGVTYDWKLDGVSTQPGAKDTLLTAAGGAGTYTVTINGTPDTGCSNTSPGFVLTATSGSAPANPVINNNVPCLGSALNLSTANVAGGAFKWTGPSAFTSSTQNPTINPVTNGSSGVYTLQVTVGSCSSNIISKRLDVASVPVLPVTASPSATVCIGGSVTLALPAGVTNPAYTFQWKNAAGNIGGATSNSYVTSIEDNYSVVVTSASSTCSQETAVTTVKIFAKPTVDFTPSSPQCKGVSIQFTSSVTGDPRGTLTYSWTFGDGGTSTSASPTYTYSTANSYGPNLVVGYAELAGCTSNVTKPITINAPVVPTILSSANPICPGDQTTLSITGSFTSINWTGVTGNSASVMISQPGDYGVATIDAKGCSSSGTLTIGLKPSITPFTAKSGRSAITSGDTTKLTTTTGADSYLWQPGKTLNDSTISNPIATPTSLPITYIVVAKKSGFCDATASVTINGLSEGAAIIKPPVLFSPNGDKINDDWKLCYNPNDPSATCPEEVKYFDWTMTIFDGHGSQVYQQKGFTHWDGGSAPDGVYYYVFSNSKDKPSTGSVLLVRQKQ